MELKNEYINQESKVNLLAQRNTFENVYYFKHLHKVLGGLENSPSTAIDLFTNKVTHFYTHLNHIQRSAIFKSI